MILSEECAEDDLLCKKICDFEKNYKPVKKKNSEELESAKKFAEKSKKKLDILKKKPRIAVIKPKGETIVVSKTHAKMFLTSACSKDEKRRLSTLTQIYRFLMKNERYNDIPRNYKNGWRLDMPSGNFTYMLMPPIKPSKLIIEPFGKKKCSIKTLGLVVTRVDRQTEYLGPVNLESPREYQEIEFNIDEEIERVEIVAIDTWGDKEHVCFFGAKLYPQ